MPSLTGIDVNISVLLLHYDVAKVLSFSFEGIM